MNSIKKRLAGILLVLGMIGGGSLVAAPAAQAYNSWYYEVIRCDYIYTYYTVDYNWWEETFQGKTDYTVYVGYRYQYNWACHNVRPY